MASHSYPGTDPANAEEVRAALTEWATAEFGSSARLAEAPRSAGTGYDTYIWFVRLEGEGVPEPFTHEFVARVFPGALQQAKAEREHAVQHWCTEQGFPAPRPLALLSADGPFGLPVLMMEGAPGRPMLADITSRPWEAGRYLRLLGAWHAVLHRIDPSTVPFPVEGALIDRRLAELRRSLDADGLRRNERELAWLDEHRWLVTPEGLSVLHNDFHPLNVLVAASGDGDRRNPDVTIIDWSTADVGDRHHDVARTLVIFWVSPIAANGRHERVGLRLSRGWLASTYQAAYAQHLPLDGVRLRYWQAFHCLDGALLIERLHGEGFAEGTRHDNTQRVPASLAPALRKRFWQMTDHR